MLGASSTVMYFMSGIVARRAPEQIAGKWTSIIQASALTVGFGAPIVGEALYGISPYASIAPSIIILPILAGIAMYSGLTKS
jgi:hypothetical protein